jgi:hypothetical protein
VMDLSSSREEKTVPLVRRICSLQCVLEVLGRVGNAAHCGGVCLCVVIVCWSDLLLIRPLPGHARFCGCGGHSARALILKCQLRGPALWRGCCSHVASDAKLIVRAACATLTQRPRGRP